MKLRSALLHCTLYFIKRNRKSQDRRWYDRSNSFLSYINLYLSETEIRVTDHMVFHICKEINNYWQLYLTGTLFKATKMDSFIWNIPAGELCPPMRLNLSISLWPEAPSQWSYHRIAFHFQMASLSWRVPDLLRRIFLKLSPVMIWKVYPA